MLMMIIFIISIIDKFCLSGFLLKMHSGIIFNKHPKEKHDASSNLCLTIIFLSLSSKINK